MTRLMPPVLAWALLLPLPALATPAYLPGTPQAQQALQALPALQAARAQASASDHAAEAVRRGPHEFEASVTPQRRTTREAGRFDEWEVQVGRAIRLPGKAALDGRIATQMQVVAGHELADARRDARQQLLADWLAWLGSERAQTLLQRQRDLLQREQEAAALLHRKGALAALDLDLVQADLASAQARLIAADAAAAQARQRLQQAYPGLALPAALPEVTPVLPEDASDAAVQRLVDGNPALAAARARATGQALLADRARADRRADPTVGVRWLREGREPETALGVVISVPFGGGYRRALAQAEGARETALFATAEDVQRRVQQQAWDAVQQARLQHARWQAEEAALQAHRRAAERSRQAFALGELGMAPYLLAERALLDRELVENTARIDAALRAGELQLQAGTLWPAQD